MELNIGEISRGGNPSTSATSWLSPADTSLSPSKICYTKSTKMCIIIRTILKQVIFNKQTTNSIIE